MIKNDIEYKTTLERIAYLQNQVMHLRQVETNSENDRLSTAGFLAELDRMKLEIES